MSRARPQRGIALPALVFGVAVIGLLLGAGLQVLMQASFTQGLQLQSARALAAAKSGSEWGLWQVSDPNAALGLDGNTLPPCFATTTLTLPEPLADFTVQVSCSREPGSGSLDEGGLKLASYRVLAVASNGVSGDIQAVQRQFEARTTVCKNPGAAGPRYAC